MSVNVTVQFPAELERDLNALAGGRRAVTEHIANTIEELLRDHFQELQGHPRSDGLKSTGFWFGGKKSVVSKIGDHVFHNDSSATITIDSPELRHKLDGGLIKASDHGHPYLTLPATDAAAQADQGARSFATHIEWLPHPDGGIRPALVLGEKRRTGEKKTDGTASEALFWLVRQVSHKPMPEALPSDGTIGDASREAALDAIDALLAIKGEVA